MEIYQDITLDMLKVGLVHQANALKSGIRKRLSKHENFLVDLTVVAMLNPNLDSKKLLPKELEKYYDSAKNLIKSKIPHQSENNKGYSSPRARRQSNNLNEFKVFKEVNLSSKVNVVDYWKCNKLNYPNLFRLAEKYFCMRT